jgi:hypothetical protein
MPQQSRSELINEIREARREAKANMLYVKGLTKMKRKELREIFEEIKYVNKNLKTDDEEDNSYEIQELEAERDELQKELDDLEKQADEAKVKQVELEELEDDYYDNIDEKEEKEKDEKENQYKSCETAISNYIKENEEIDELSEEEPEPETAQQPPPETEEYTEDELEDDEPEEQQEKMPTTVKKYIKNKVEDEIYVLLDDFENMIQDILYEFKEKDPLTDADADEIENYYNDQKDALNDLINKAIDELPKDTDLYGKTYKKIDRVIAKQEKAVSEFINY